MSTPTCSVTTPNHLHWLSEFPSTTYAFVFVCHVKVQTVGERIRLVAPSEVLVLCVEKKKRAGTKRAKKKPKLPGDWTNHLSIITYKGLQSTCQSNRRRVLPLAEWVGKSNSWRSRSGEKRASLPFFCTSFNEMDYPVLIQLMLQQLLHQPLKKPLLSFSNEASFLLLVVASQQIVIPQRMLMVGWLIARWIWEITWSREPCSSSYLAR